jgi:N-acetylglutamate synthase-like GNAT family acetyltransferase
MDIKEIEFETLKKYWVEVNHFSDTHVIKDVIKVLGAHITPYSAPKRIAYGLYSNNTLVGATQLVQWNEDTVRYRTINIVKEHRGKDLGWYLLNNAYKQDWNNYSKLFGWVKLTHFDWARRHGFKEIDSDWTDGHIGMVKWM